MTDRLTDQQLAQYETLANAATPGPWHLTDADAIVAPLTGIHVADVWEPTAAIRNGEFIEAAREALPALVAEVHRLRTRTLTESEHNRAWHAIEGAAGEEGADPGTVLNAVLWALGLNPPAAEETHVVADDSDDPEHVDDCPGCETETGTRQCGHDDYHDPHEWADRPGTWCPGHAITEEAESAPAGSAPLAASAASTAPVRVSEPATAPEPSEEPERPRDSHTDASVVSAANKDQP